MKKILSITAVIICGLYMALAAIAGSGNQALWNSEDEGAAIRIRNKGSEKVVISISTNGSSTTNWVLIGSTTTTIDGSGTTDTIAELAAAIIAATNSAGVKVLEADTKCVAATTESTDGELLDQRVTINAGEWGSIAWDTSVIKHYDVYIPPMSAGPSRGAGIITKIFGNIGGTGDITLGLYVDRDLKYQKIIESPLYIQGVVSTNGYVADDVSAGMLGGASYGGLDVPLPFGQDQAVLIRGTRATTGTTGGIGVSFKLD